jgi:hypothetical protein
MFHDVAIPCLIFNVNFRIKFIKCSHQETQKFYEASFRRHLIKHIPTRACFAKKKTVHKSYFCQRILFAEIIYE